MSDTKITNGDLAGITARAKVDIYEQIGKILHETREEAIYGRKREDGADWAKAAQARLKEELGIQWYRAGDEIPGGVDSNLVMAYVEDPPSFEIAESLNQIGALSCEHERSPCNTFCGVFRDPRTNRWAVIPMPWRLDWLARIARNVRHGQPFTPGPRLLALCGPERLTDEWFAQSESFAQRIDALRSRFIVTGAPP